MTLLFPTLPHQFLLNSPGWKGLPTLQPSLEKAFPKVESTHENPTTFHQMLPYQL